MGRMKMGVGKRRRMKAATIAMVRRRKMRRKRRRRTTKLQMRRTMRMMRRMRRMRRRKVQRRRRRKRRKATLWMRQKMPARTNPSGPDSSKCPSSSSASSPPSRATARKRSTSIAKPRPQGPSRYAYPALRFATEQEAFLPATATLSLASGAERLRDGLALLWLAGGGKADRG